MAEPELKLWRQTKPIHVLLAAQLGHQGLVRVSHDEMVERGAAAVRGFYRGGGSHRTAAGREALAREVIAAAVGEGLWTLVVSATREGS